MNNRYSGFTLLELMIAVTIVGILASLSIPTYQSYTIRAKVSEALNMATAAKFSVSEYYISRGALPESSEQAGISDISTKYVDSLVYKETDTGGDIILTLSNQLGDNANGKKIRLTTTINGETLAWVCQPTEEEGLDNKYLPSSCR